MLSQTMLQVLFWGSSACLVYTFLGYPALTMMLAQTRRRRARGMASPTPASPPVSVVLPVCNEEARITDRISNLLTTTYPAQRVEIIIVSDGSTDGTDAAVDAFPDDRVRILRQAQQTGKASCLNRGVAAATGSIVVFADARQDFEPETIPALVARFADDTVAAVSGELRIRRAAGSIGRGIDAYWRLERRLRQAESDLGASIGCTGAVYAIRKAAYESVPDDTILDDVVIPLQAAVRGGRILFEPGAVAWDPQTLDAASERRRKRRTLAGNLQMLLRYPQWLLPWRNPTWWRLLSHKYLRLTGPLLMLSCLLVSALLHQQPIYAALLSGQLVFYCLAALGRLCPHWHFPLVAWPAGFVFLNLQVLGAVAFYLRGGYRRGWR